MKMRELQGLTEQEITSRIAQAEREYLSIHQSVESGREKNVRKVKTARRDIARLYTAKVMIQKGHLTKTV